MSRHAGFLILVLVGCGVVAWSWLPVRNDVQAHPVPVHTAAEGWGEVRGVTVSCFRWGPGEWDAPAMADHLGRLAGLGVNWVTIHPYASIRNDGSLRNRNPAYEDAVAKSTAWARQRGQAMLIKPHLGYWGSRFGWRGEITFSDEASWDRFFSDYERFICEQAEQAEAAGAAAFCVGTELAGTLRHEQRWRQLIAEVRQRFSGHLTYAANWDEYRAVPFWDALDVVGIQAYFPLTEAAPPTEAQLSRGWRAVMTEVEAFAAQRGKPLVFTEVGYAPSSAAAVRPWNPEPGGEAAEATKLLCLRVALDEIGRAQRRGVLRGAFLWKTFATDRRVDREFTLNYPEAEAVLRGVWAAGP